MAKTYFNRSIVVGEQQEITRNVVEKHGVATVRYQNQKQEVVPVGPPLSKQTKWTLKK